MRGIAADVLPLHTNLFAGTDAVGNAMMFALMLSMLVPHSLVTAREMG